MKRFLKWWMTFLRHHRPAMVGALLLGLVLLVAIVAPWFAVDPSEVVAKGQSEPSAERWLGTDPLGYDLWARMVAGARATLYISLAATMLSLALVTLLGAVAGYFGRWVDMLIMRFVDFMMSFPSFLLAMVTVALLGQGLEKLIVAVGVVGAPLIARQVRAEVLRVREIEFTAAARALGFGKWRVLFRHVMPNAIGPIIVLGTLGMGSAILDVAGLNFLGLGGDPYAQSEWGLLLQQGWNEGSRGTLQVTVAGIALLITVLGLNLLGDGLKDELDPRTRRR
ncbi:MAG: ABC transporter permease [Planctomycetes bacterium]|nr:ABC transporter permease [Planctomycetota bacterium]